MVHFTSADYTEPSEPYVFEELTIEYAERRVSLADRAVRLTNIEYRLLFELSVNAGLVLTHDQLLQRVWGLEHPGRPGGGAHLRQEPSPQAGRRRGQPHLHLHRAPGRLPDGEGGGTGVADGSLESRLLNFRDKGAGGGDSEGYGYPPCHHQADAGVRRGDLLLSNMAWALRRFPIFPVFGRRDYQVQPIYAEDLAAQAVDVGSGRDSFVADAAGPETFTFEELLRLLASSMGVRRWFLHTPPRAALALTGLVGLLMREMALTHDEVVGLMAGLLTSEAAPTGTTRLSDWLAENGDGLGRRYVSELRRNYRG